MLTWFPSLFGTLGGLLLVYLLMILFDLYFSFEFWGKWKCNVAWIMVVLNWRLYGGWLNPGCICPFCWHLLIQICQGGAIYAYFFVLITSNRILSYSRQTYFPVIINSALELYIVEIYVLNLFTTITLEMKIILSSPLLKLFTKSWQTQIHSEYYCCFYQS